MSSQPREDLSLTEPELDERLEKLVIRLREKGVTASLFLVLAIVLIAQSVVERRARRGHRDVLSASDAGRALRTPTICGFTPLDMARALQDIYYGTLDRFDQSTTLVAPVPNVGRSARASSSRHLEAY